MNVGQYTKAIVAIGAAGVAVLAAALSDGVVSPLEFVNVLIAIVTAVGVYKWPNDQAGTVLAQRVKTITAATGAALAALANILTIVFDWQAVSLSDWLFVLLAGLSAVGIYVLPNTTPTVTKTVTAGDFSVTATAPAEHVEAVLSGDANPALQDVVSEAEAAAASTPVQKDL